MFDVGVPELILVLVVALVVFGPGKLPEIGAALGKTIREFRKATQSITDEIQSVTKAEDELRTELMTSLNVNEPIKSNESSQPAEPKVETAESKVETAEPKVETTEPTVETAEPKVEN